MKVVDIDRLCFELYNTIKNNYEGDVTKNNFHKKFEMAKKEILEDVKECINQNKVTMVEEFDLK